jgi:hypothetical protein
VPGIGILLPSFAAALVAIGMSLLLDGPGELPYRPPVAFVAGVLGPLVGADLGETGGEWRFRRRSEEALSAFYSMLAAKDFGKGKAVSLWPISVCPDRGNAEIPPCTIAEGHGCKVVAGLSQRLDDQNASVPLSVAAAVAFLLLSATSG